MKRSRKYLRRTTAAILSVWLSGVVLLLLCQMPMRAATSDSCPLARASSDHCKKKKSDKGMTLTSVSESPVFNCCSFIPAVFDKARKLERNSNPVVPVTKPSVQRTEIRAAVERPRVADFYNSFRPSKNRSFIINQVFRI